MLEPSQESLRGSRVDMWGHTMGWAGFGALFMIAAAFRPCAIALSFVG